MTATTSAGRELPPFDRRFFRSAHGMSRIGGGALGAKAERLVLMHGILATEGAEGRFGGLPVDVPRFTVLATESFDAFLAGNPELRHVLDADPADERIATSFQRAHLPSDVVGDLEALAEEAHTPLAVRSSSRLEDALERPFAGVYQTKMIPNHDPDPRERFRALVEAIKFVYASTYFEAARSYRAAAGISDSDEKMAVIVQEIVGERHGDRFYPDVSAVCRSWDYYPRGRAAPEDGVVSLALGLGKTIVDGGRCWGYSPRHPKAPPPFGSTAQLLRETQSRFWAVHMGPPPPYDPIAETEYLLQATLDDADYDGTLRFLASTYDGAADRLRPGTDFPGPRVLDFAPILRLRELPLNDVFLALLQTCERALGGPVEIELALTLPGRLRPPARAGFLQVRPMSTPSERVSLRREDLAAPDLLLRSTRAMGNGVLADVRDIVYVRPEHFSAAQTPRIAQEVGEMNQRLVRHGRRYLLIGFGRWGSSEPWLGIPATWSQVGGAAAIVEVAGAHLDVEPSQGTHFFHNLSSLGRMYLMLRDTDVDWAWLAEQPAEQETELVRHLRLDAPLHLAVDGRSRTGIVRRPANADAPPNSSSSSNLAV
ncbi:MAG TPA: PEP/pyruvate-binding domain-containing protein [Longimicrobiales bacterium]